MAIDSNTAGIHALEHVNNSVNGLFDPKIISVKSDKGDAWIVTILCFGKPHYNSSGQLLPPPKVYQTVRVDAFDGSILDDDTLASPSASGL